MLGAIVGDIAGSRFEFHNRKSKKFTFLKCRAPQNTTPDGGRSHGYCCHFTDDTVMTLAVAQALMDWRESGSSDYGELSVLTVRAMQDFGRRYPRAGYGGHFAHWIGEVDPKPYRSWGNGAAMRVSACGWAGRTVEEVRALSHAVTAVTHNHPEGIKGAEATAVATFLARTGVKMDEIRKMIVRDYYPLDFTLDQIRPYYSFDVSCQGSVPQALEAFFESTSFEDAIRNAISIGGDSDTIGAICGAVAGAYYGVPAEIYTRAVSFLSPHLQGVLHGFERIFEVKVADIRSEESDDDTKVATFYKRNLGEVMAMLNPDEVMAVVFAEVGAQGTPQYASVVSRSRDGSVFVDSGSYCIDDKGGGRGRYGSGVEAESLENLVPFLRCMRGDSFESTIRGFGWSHDGEWYHFDACFGNHLIVRRAIAQNVANQFSDNQFAVYHEGLCAVLYALGIETGGNKEI